MSGLFVRVRVPASEPYAALLIPERALATDQDIKYVYIVGSDGVASRRNVVLGAQRGDMRIITSGLQAGDNVIVKGLQRVRPGQKVEAEQESPVSSNAPPASSAAPPAPHSPAQAAPEQPNTPASEPAAASPE